LISSILLWIVNRVAANPNPVRKLYYSSFFSSCLFFKKVSISFSNCLSASVGGTSTSFATSRNEGLPSRTISFIVIISLITPKMFIICIGPFLKDWDCGYSSHRKNCFFWYKIYILRRMHWFVIRCCPLLPAGTASASLPWQRVCRRCWQRTVLVDLP